MLDLNEIAAVLESHDANEPWIEREEFYARIGAWLPALVAELTQAREEIAVLLEYGEGLVDALHQAEAEVKRLQALVPPPELLRRLAEWANEAVLDGGDCLGEDMGTEEYPNTDDVEQARALARRIRVHILEEAQANDRT